MFMNPILQVGEPRHREVRSFAGEHTARASEFVFLAAVLCWGGGGGCLWTLCSDVQKIFKHFAPGLPIHPVIVV